MEKEASSLLYMHLLKHKVFPRRGKINKFIFQYVKLATKQSVEPPHYGDINEFSFGISKVDCPPQETNILSSDNLYRLTNV